MSQHRVLSWVSVGIGEEDSEINAEEVVRKHKVPQKVLLEYIGHEIEEEETFKLEQKSIPQDVFGSVTAGKRKDAEKKPFIGAAERFKRARTNQ